MNSAAASCQTFPARVERVPPANSGGAQSSIAARDEDGEEGARDSLQGARHSSCHKRVPAAHSNCRTHTRLRNWSEQPGTACQFDDDHAKL